MKKMKKMKKYVGLLLALMLCGSAVGCGGNGDNGGFKEVEGKTNIRVATYNGGVGKQWLEDAARAFETKFAGESFEEGKTGELGWVIDKEYQNKGFVTEAAEALIKYAKEEFGIFRIIAQCDSENYASCRVAEKLGMKLIDDKGTRKNKGSEEIRKEFTFELIC